MEESNFAKFKAACGDAYDTYRNGLLAEELREIVKEKMKLDLPISDLAFLRADLKNDGFFENKVATELRSIVAKLQLSVMKDKYNPYTESKRTTFK
jgi:ABC-type Fe3+ transport system substrate-binding protein